MLHYFSYPLTQATQVILRYTEQFFFGETTENAALLRRLFTQTTIPAFVNIREFIYSAKRKGITGLWRDFQEAPLFDKFSTQGAIICLILTLFSFALWIDVGLAPIYANPLLNLVNVLCAYAFIFGFSMALSAVILYPCQILINIAEMGFPFPAVRFAATCWARWIIFRGRTNEILSGGNTWLHWAARNGYQEAARLLLDAGANMEATNDRGNTPLLYAAEAEGYRSHHEVPFHPSMRVIPLLIHRGANIHARGCDELYYAVRQRRALPFHPTRHTKSSILYLAANSGNLETVHYLIQHMTADHLRHCINEPNGLRYTPLYFAASFGYFNIVQALTYAGANINYRTNNITPIEEAYTHGHHNIVDFLAEQESIILPPILRERDFNKVNINTPQNVHTLSVHLSVSGSAKKLQARYSPPESMLLRGLHWVFPSRFPLPYDLDNAREALFSFMQQAFVNADENNLTDAHSATKRWLRDPQHLDFVDEGSKRSSVSTRALLGYLWLGLNDENEGLWYTDSKKQNKKSRAVFEQDLSEALARGFYRIQRTYNLDENDIDDGTKDAPSCASGTFNKIIEMLNTLHSSVEIRVISTEVIQRKAEVYIDAHLRSLPLARQQHIAKYWTIHGTMPEDFLQEMQMILSRRLRETFEQYQDEIHQFPQTIQAIVDNLEYVPPTKTVQTYLPSGGASSSSSAPPLAATQQQERGLSAISAAP